MNRSFIFFNCLLSVVILQAHPLLADCGCGKKKEIEKKSMIEIISGGGCACNDEICCGSDDIPADQD